MSISFGGPAPVETVKASEASAPKPAASKAGATAKKGVTKGAKK